MCEREREGERPENKNVQFTHIFYVLLALLRWRIPTHQRTQSVGLFATACARLNLQKTMAKRTIVCTREWNQVCAVHTHAWTQHTSTAQHIAQKQLALWKTLPTNLFIFIFFVLYFSANGQISIHTDNEAMSIVICFTFTPWVASKTECSRTWYRWRKVHEFEYKCCVSDMSTHIALTHIIHTLFNVHIILFQQPNNQRNNNSNKKCQE